MDTNRMKLGLVYIFSENKNITKTAKLQLINFIEQADIHQLKVLVMDGELVPKKKLDEVTRQIIDARFEPISEVGILLGALLATTLVTAAVVAKKLKRRGQFRCQKITDREKYYKCMADSAKTALDAKISVLKNNMKRCSQTKNPDKCNSAFIKAIKKVEKEKDQQIAKYTKKLANVHA